MNALKLHFLKTILKILILSLYNRFLDRKQTFHVSVGRDIMFIVYNIQRILIQASLLIELNVLSWYMSADKEGSVARYMFVIPWEPN